MQNTLRHAGCNGTEKMIQRDKTGENPLFYCLNGGKLYHAGSIKELLKISGLKPRVTAEGIAALTLLGPGRPMSSGVLDGVRELPPGFRAEYSGGKLTVTRYWKPEAAEHPESFEETAIHARKLITESIRQALADKVKGEKPGLFLSGGLDSSIIGAVLKELGVDFKAYSVDYTGNNENFRAGTFQPAQDAPFVREMREFLKCGYRDVEIGTDSLFESLKPAVIARGLPGMADVDGSLYLFCGEVAKEARFVFSGECADETVRTRWGSKQQRRKDEIHRAED